MAIANNEREARKIANEDTAKKIALEVPLLLNIRRWWKNIGNKFAKQYIQDGTVVDFTNFKDELTSILKKSYKKTSNTFQNNLRESLDEIPNRRLMNSFINDEIQSHININAPVRSDLITGNAQKRLNIDLLLTIAATVEAGRTLGRKEIAEETKETFNARADGKATTISITEVQNSAGATKEIEQNALSGSGVLIGGVTLAMALTRMWVTTLDEKTRTPHIFADGQRKKFGERFFVGGELLRYPGDPNGSPGNIINCRCDDPIVIA